MDRGNNEQQKAVLLRELGRLNGMRATQLFVDAEYLLSDIQTVCDKTAELLAWSMKISTSGRRDSLSVVRDGQARRYRQLKEEDKGIGDDDERGDEGNAC